MDGLHLTHMEHRVDSHVRRQGQANRNRIYNIRHLERANKPRGQFFCQSRNINVLST